MNGGYPKGRMEGLTFLDENELVLNNTELTEEQIKQIEEVIKEGGHLIGDILKKISIKE